MAKLWEQDHDSRDTLLEAAENEFEHSRAKNGQRQNRKAIISALFMGAMISSLCWVLASLIPHHPFDNRTIHTTTNTEIGPQTTYMTSCGQTPAAARALGCKFQLWMYAWVPMPCYDGEIEEEYLAKRDWGYYLDKEGKHEVNASVAGAGEGVIWTTWGQHYWHCFFTVKKLVRSVALNGSGVGLTEADIGPENTHMDHCLTSLLEKDKHPWDEIMDDMYVNYAGCYMNGVGNWSPVRWELSSHEEFREGQVEK